VKYSALSILAASLALAGCMNLAPAYNTPAAPVPDSVSTDALASPAVASAESLTQAQALTWVQVPALQQVLALALSHNRDLRIAWANIEKARAQYGVQQADQLPSINASGQGNRSRANAATSSQFSAQIGFTSYELDLWGRVRNLNDAALQQFLQTTVNQRSAEITLLADVANAWLTLAADQARLELAQDTLTAQRKAFELTQRMHALGAMSGLVLAQNQTIVDKARADVAGFASQVDKSRNALQLLVGGVLPADLLPPPLTHAMPASAALLALPTPLPSSRLLSRPDIQAAEHALRGATANIGAARAALFPSISLTASTGSASRELSGLFDGGSGTWSFVPQIRLPIFDGGRNQANVRIAEANQQLALAQYEKTVQIAFREVADALAERAHWSERLDAQSSLVAATQKALTLSQARFKSGADNYLSVLDAQRSLYAAQQTDITLRLAEQANRITLYKVLGGG
jgi:NodT family efflux transporter outer membrane factor (OMF) lipoprotein